MTEPENTISRSEFLYNREIVELSAIETLSLKAEGGPESAPAAFQRLEEYAPPKGRRFYGVFDTPAGIYRVCTKIKEGDELLDPILEPFTIPGGLFAYRKLVGEHDDLIPQIPIIFQELMGKYMVDQTRPSIEFYRRLNEFRLYLPVTI